MREFVSFILLLAQFWILSYRCSIRNETTQQNVNNVYRYYVLPDSRGGLIKASSSVSTLLAEVQ